MNILVVGLNHVTAPIEIRERFSLPQRELKAALSALREYDSIEEALILSTCNRVEVYAAAKEISPGFESIQDFLSNFFRIVKGDVKGSLYLLNNVEAIRHLFNVVSSLDSMIIGENQILGQVKETYFKAREYNATGKNLNFVFEEAIKTGKRVRTETQIGKGAVSVSSTAIELAKKIFESLEGKKVLIIGAGKVGELAVKNLFGRGIETVLVANRNFERAEELAGQFRGKAIRFESIGNYLEQSDIVISSTSASHFILKEKQVAEIMKKRKNAPLFLIDLGVPRNIEPEVNKIDNVYVYNIDDLARIRQVNIQERLIEAAKAKQIVEKYTRQVALELFRCL